MEETVSTRPAKPADLAGVIEFLQPFVDQQYILPRSSVQLELLLRHAFVAELAGAIVGFAAVEIYSKKLAEIQCLAVSESCRSTAVLTTRCRARREHCLCKPATISELAY